MSTPTDLASAVAALQTATANLVAIPNYSPDCTAITASTIADTASVIKLVNAAPPVNPLDPAPFTPITFFPVGH